jgi:hypothetical protein
MLDGLRLPVYEADDGASFPTRPGRSWSWKRSCRRRQGVAALIPLFRGFPANSGVPARRRTWVEETGVSPKVLRGI